MPPICSVTDCSNKAYGRGWCRKHHTRWLRHGDPLHVEVVGSPEVRFHAKVRKGWMGDCWLWTGAVSSGYGTLYIDNRNVYAHRFSYELHVGPIPHGKQIDHLCRVQPCVNPDHLEAVTPRTNILRGNAPSAVAVRTNRCRRGHEFTEENTYWRPDGRGRQCRACARLRERRHAEV